MEGIFREIIMTTLGELKAKLGQLNVPDSTPVYLDCSEFPKILDSIVSIDREKLLFPDRSYFSHEHFVKLS